MADIAQIGFGADTSALVDAKDKLEALVPAAVKVEKATEKMEKALEGAATAASASATSAKNVTAALNGTGTAANSAATATAKITMSANSATVAMNAEAVAATKAAAAATALSGVATKVGQAHGTAAVNTANLAAQFQDIAVTAAMGMSPLQIALQQGTQISAAFGTAGAAGVLSSLGAAFMAIISPVSLATIAIVAGGVAIAQYFFSTDDSASKAEAALKEQADLIRGVTTAWEGAVPALQGYLDQLDRAAEAAQRTAAYNSAVTGTYADLASKVSEANVLFAEMLSQLDLAGTKQTVIAELNTKFQEFKTAVDDGRATTVEFNAVQDILNSAMLAGIPGVEAFAATFLALAEKVGIASAAMKDLRAEQADIKKNTLEQNQPYEDLPSVPWDVPTPERRPKIELEGLPGQYNGDGTLKGAKSGGGGRVKKTAAQEAAEDYKSLTDGAQRTIATLTAQSQALGLSAEAASKLKYETQLLNQAQQKGIELTPTQREELMALAGTMSTLELATAKAKEEAKKAQEAMDFAKEVTGGFFEDMRSGLESGKSIWESFGDAALNVLDKIADKLLNEVLDALFQVNDAGAGGGGGGFLGSILGMFTGGGGGGAAADPWAGMRFAKGGAFTNSIVSQPTPFTFANGGAFGLMGEAGPEAIMPLARGSDGSLGVQMVQGGGGSAGVSSSGAQVIDFNLHLTDDSGRMSEIADQQIQTRSGDIINIAVKTTKQELPAIMADQQRRGKI